MKTLEREIMQKENFFVTQLAELDEKYSKKSKSKGRTISQNDRDQEDEASKYLQDPSHSKAHSKAVTTLTHPLQTLNPPISSSDNNMVQSIPEKNESEVFNETGTVEDKLILKQLELLEQINPQSDLLRQ